MSLLRSCIAAIAVFTVCNEMAFAQEPPAVGGVGARRIRRPTTSPYLNLLQRPGGQRSMALQYYGIVRPEQEFRGAISSQYQATQELRRQVDEQGALLLQSQNSQLGPTGHQVRFLDLSGYFGAFR